MKKGTIFIVTGLLLIAAAFGLVAYNFYDTRRAGKASEGMLEQLEIQIPEDPVPVEGRSIYDDPIIAEEHPLEIEYPDYVLNPEMDMPVQVIDGQECIGVIHLPTQNKEFPVISDWSYAGLKIAPCRYSGSAYLNDLVICAHNYSIHFGTLNDLSYGDPILFTDTDGNEFTYKVAEIETLPPTAIDKMINSEWDLSLFTCTLSGTARVTVRCERVSP